MQGVYNVKWSIVLTIYINSWYILCKRGEKWQINRGAIQGLDSTEIRAIEATGSSRWSSEDIGLCRFTAGNA